MIQLRIEAALSGSVYDVLTGAAVTWTDITAYTMLSQGVGWSRGRRPGSESDSPGQASFTLATVSGAHVALTVRTPVRISRWDGAAWETRWTGAVAQVRRGWQNGVRGVQQVVCADLRTVTERITLESLPVMTIRQLNPTWLVPLDDEPDGGPRELVGGLLPLVVDEAGVVPSGCTITSGGYGPGSAPGHPESNALVIEGGDLTGGWCLHAESPTAEFPSLYDVSGDEVTVGVWVYCPSHTTDRTVWAMNSHVAGSTINLALVISGGGYVCLDWYGSRTYTWGAVPTGRWVHIAWTNSLSGYDLWIDGVIVHSEIGFLDCSGLGQRALRIGAQLDGSEPWSGWVGPIHAHRTLLSAGDLADIVASAELTEPTQTRFGRLLELTGTGTTQAAGLSWEELAALGYTWTAFHSTGATWGNVSGSLAGRTVRTIGIMGPQPVRGQSLAAALDAVGLVETTGWAPAPDGTLALASRADRYNRDPDLTLSATSVDASTAVELSDRGLVSEVIASRPGMTPYVARDAAATTAYGESSETVTLCAGSDGEVTTWADWRLTTRKAPGWDTDRLVIDAYTCGIDEDIVLGVDVGDLLHVTGMPSDAPASTVRLWVDGVEDQVTPSGWVRTLTTSTAPADTSAWVLGVDTLDSGTVLAL